MWKSISENGNPKEGGDYMAAIKNGKTGRFFYAPVTLIKTDDESIWTDGHGHLLFHLGWIIIAWFDLPLYRGLKPHPQVIRTRKASDYVK